MGKIKFQNQLPKYEMCMMDSSIFKENIYDDKSMRNMIINSKPAAVLKNCQFHAPLFQGLIIV